LEKGGREGEDENTEYHVHNKNDGEKHDNGTAQMDGVEITTEMGMRRLASPLSEDQGKTSVKERASVRNQGNTVRNRNGRS
jgi:hypothetical protein